MKNNNFINHEDPTRSFDPYLKNVDLREQYSKLTEDEKLLIYLKISGYSHCPPTVERLYSDEYYLGSERYFNHGDSIFPFWKESLKKIVPNQVFTSTPFLLFGGAIGIGKSTVSKILLALTYSRLSCLPNPYKLLGTARKPLTAMVLHRNELTAEIEFKNWFEKDVLVNSPFFKNVPHRPDFTVKIGGVRSNPGLGSDVIFSILSELEHWPNIDAAKERLNTTLIRMTSRYDVEKTLTQIGFLILDSSAKDNGADGPSVSFLETAPPKYIFYSHPSHWDVRTNLYERSKGRTFSVYTGDGKYPPQILPEDYKLGFDQDPNLVLRVPWQLYGEFRADITKALQDKAGVTTASDDSFFGGNISHVMSCSKIKNRIPEIIMVDFYDKTDRLIDKVEPMINLIPRNTPIWLGLDLAVNSDICGISAVSFDHWEYVGDTKLPKMRCHFMLGISRKEGQQTSLFHIFDLIVALSKRFRLVVSADQAFSRQILQDCERENIKTNGRISTDNSPCEPALYLKNILNQELIELPEHRRFLREAYDLKYVTNKVSGKIKIDHPKKATQDPKIFDINNGVGSKDIWDSLASAVYSLKLSIDAGEEFGYDGGVTRQLDALKDITKDSREEAKDKFQSMLEGLF